MTTHSQTHGLNADLYSTNWSGAVVPAAAGHSFATVSAEWVVPKVTQVPIRGETLTDAAEWVGIDGTQSNDVCQAGVLQTVQTAANGRTTVTCNAWDEWYPNNAKIISSASFKVNPGDTISVTVKTSGAGATRARFLFDDLTTGETHRSKLTAPPGVSLQGSSAEYVVETPELISGGTVSQPLLTDFVRSPVVFAHARATSVNGPGPGLSSATPIDLFSDKVPGLGGSWAEEAYGSVSPASDTVTVTENPYWPSVPPDHCFVW
jgi:Peptidase A4 family